MLRIIAIVIIIGALIMGGIWSAIGMAVLLGIIRFIVDGE